MASPHRSYATVSALVFALVAIAQGWRTVAGVPVQIDTVQVPLAASAAIALVCAGLAVWGWRTR